MNYTIIGLRLCSQKTSSPLTYCTTLDQVIQSIPTFSLYLPLSCLSHPTALSSLVSTFTINIHHPPTILAYPSIHVTRHKNHSTSIFALLHIFTSQDNTLHLQLSKYHTHHTPQLLHTLLFTLLSPIYYNTQPKLDLSYTAPNPDQSVIINKTQHSHKISAHPIFTFYILTAPPNLPSSVFQPPTSTSINLTTITLFPFPPTTTPHSSLISIHQTKLPSLIRPPFSPLPSHHPLSSLSHPPIHNLPAPYLYILTTHTRSHTKQNSPTSAQKYPKKLTNVPAPLNYAQSQVPRTASSTLQSQTIPTSAHKLESSSSPSLHNSPTPSMLTHTRHYTPASPSNSPPQHTTCNQTKTTVLPSPTSSPCNMFVQSHP